ncbi:hypothetical protein [Clostridium estertheticum]|nr:hypothetical protein [Clostridium estertheticum]MCB2358470.1 hypothetical protein [Clostridium estertheticum]
MKRSIISELMNLQQDDFVGDNGKNIKPTFTYDFGRKSWTDDANKL